MGLPGDSDGPRRTSLDVLEPLSKNDSPGHSKLSSLRDRLRSLVELIKLYTAYYPGITSFLASIVVVFSVLSMALSFRKPITRNQLHHDYSKIDMHYNFQAAKVDHWCLWGGDTACTCDDFTTPLSREEKKGWVQTHSGNTKRIVVSKYYDVVFIGDEVAEGWNGEWLGRPGIPTGDALKTKNFFTDTFTKDGGGEFEGLALGIMGDDSPNVLWRLRHGELPNTLQSKVFWLVTGINDLVRGACSEEVAVLGILRVADEIYFSNPNSVIVIQGLLPWTKHKDGSLSPATNHNRQHLFGRHKDETAYKTLKAATKFGSIWPSIQHVNSELARFCAEHDHLVFFDASPLFLGTMGNHVYQSKEQHIIPALMEGGQKLTYEGYKVLGDAILKELERIIYDDNEANDVETRGGQRKFR